MGYKHKDERLDQIGRDLSVQYVLENSLRQSGDHLRITSQLLQVKDQCTVTAEAAGSSPVVPAIFFNHLQALVPTDQEIFGDDKRLTRIPNCESAA